MLVPEPVKVWADSASALAERLVVFARTLRDLLQEQGSDQFMQTLRELHGQYLPELTGLAFADFCAQTLCLASFAARLTDGSLPPTTSPLLESLFAALRLSATNPRFADLMRELTDLLATSNPFAWRTRSAADPSQAGDLLQLFYERFLAAYEPNLRSARGSYYTPPAIVSYIVSSIDALLKRDFALPTGLNELRRFQIQDPAAGVGAFLHGVLDHLRGNFMGDMVAWQVYLAELLPQLAGYELQASSYAVAHMSLGLKLAGLGYDPRGSQDSLRLLLGNALDAPATVDTLGSADPYCIVLGNPPYANFGRFNRSAWIRELLVDYKRGLGEKKLNLDDDFIKFMRYGQWCVEQARAGILAFVTNHTYLDGLTHRRMRQCLLEAFSEVYLLDLHGNSQRREYYRQSSHDENVFEIKQGVAIGIFVRRPGWTGGQARVYHCDLWGPRASKYAVLAGSDLLTTAWSRLEPAAPQYFFVPTHLELSQEWQALTPLTTIFPCHSTGIKTHLDAVFVGETDELVARQIERFCIEQESVVPVRASPAAQVREARGTSEHKARLLRQAGSTLTAASYQDYAYRPFDTRRIAYLPRAIEAGDHRYPIMRHVLQGSVLLEATRQLSQEGFGHVFVSQALTDMCLLSSATRECAYCFPLYLYSEPDDSSQRRPNLAPSFRDALARRLGLDFVPDGAGDLCTSFGPEDVLAYIYALLHAPAYRQRYAAWLRIDFPRLPLPATLALFRGLCEVGAQLLALHLLRTPVLVEEGGYPVAGSDYVECVDYRGSEEVWINATQYFCSIPMQIWELRIGGYQVCRKWLKDRRGRFLEAAEIRHYQRIVAALMQTCDLMDAIDELLRQAGGLAP